MWRPQAGASNRISDSEADLHRLWARIAGRTLQGDQGRYEVILPGRHNSAAGPDYLGAVIRFPDGINLKGDVEIHPSRYGWRAHRHHEDPRYSAVIAHVVATGPLRGVNSVSGRIPTSRRTNARGDDPYRTVRLNNDYLATLPGTGRRGLPSVLANKLRHRLTGSKVG